MDAAEPGSRTEVDGLQERFGAALDTMAELLAPATVTFIDAMIERRQFHLALDTTVESLRGREVHREVVDELTGLAFAIGLDVDVRVALAGPPTRPRTAKPATEGRRELDLSGLEDWQVGALIKTVHEARFPGKANDPVVWLSSFTIDLHVAAVAEQRNRVLLRIADRASGVLAPEDDSLHTKRRDESYVKGYPAWVAWRGRVEHDVVKRRLDQSADLRAWFAGLSRDEVRPLFRPFVVDDESADDLIAYAARTGTYRPGGAEPAERDQEPRPYARSLPEIETPEGWIDVHEVAVLRAGSSTLTDRETTSRPEAALTRRGFAERDARDCSQNAWKAGRGQLSGWRGARVDEVWAGS